MSSQVTLFTTSVTTTAKLRADIQVLDSPKSAMAESQAWNSNTRPWFAMQTIKTLLAAKGAAYEEVGSCLCSNLPDNLLPIGVPSSHRADLCAGRLGHAA
jgi:hypothetical protein